MFARRPSCPVIAVLGGCCKEEKDELSSKSKHEHGASGGKIVEERAGILRWLPDSETPFASLPVIVISFGGCIQEMSWIHNHQ